MGSENNKYLLAKYWKGETSIEEEQLLRQQWGDLPEDPESTQLFQQLDQFSNLSLGPEFGESFMRSVRKEKAKTIPLWKRFQSIAATLILLIGFCAIIAIYFKPEQSQVLAVEEDPEKAYQIATEALMLMSSKLNTASEYTAKLDYFNDATAIIKDNKNKNQN